MPVISGKAFWAKIYIPTRYQDQGDATWSIDICNLDAKNLAIAKKYGMNIKDKGDEKGEHVTIKRKAEKWGNPNTPPELIDMQKSPIHTNGSDALLGNGSEVNVSFTTYLLKNGPRKGTNGYELDVVQVSNFIPYKKKEGSGERGGIHELDVSQDGYVHEETL